MTAKRILGIVIFIGGAALIAFSIFLKSHAELGRSKIAGEQQNIEEQSQFVPRRPLRREMAKERSEEAEQKIGAASEKVDYYEEMGMWSQIGGIAFLVLGAGIVFFTRKK